MFGKKLRFRCLCLAAAHANSSEDIVDVADSYYKFCVDGEVTEKNSPLGETKDLSLKGNVDPLDAPAPTPAQDEPAPVSSLSGQADANAGNIQANN